MRQTIKARLKSYDEYMLIKNFAKQTRRSYLLSLKQFLMWREDQKLDGSINQEEARAYVLYRWNKGAKWQTINGIYSSLRKYYREVLELSWDFKKLPRPRRERVEPILISTDEVLSVINHATMYKHQIIMTLLYSTGIRLSELTNLRIEDVHSSRGKLFIKHGKAAKDRYVDIPQSVIDSLRIYYKRCQPKHYLFNGQSKGLKMSSSAVQMSIRIARKRARILKQVTTHTFRHCYATHHLENGTNIVYLQKQMGHRHLKTTARYIRLSQTYINSISHPVDNISISYHPINKR
jgi:site-specific recombinase XerD